MNVFNSSPKCSTVEVQVCRDSPPSCGHDNGKEAMWPRDVESSPVFGLSIVAGVRPRFGRSPLRLATTPPNNPFLVEPFNIGNGGDRVTLT
jgi:hypothetical protein